MPTSAETSVPVDTRHDHATILDRFRARDAKLLDTADILAPGAEPPIDRRGIEIEVRRCCRCRWRLNWRIRSALRLLAAIRACSAVGARRTSGQKGARPRLVPPRSGRPISPVERLHQKGSISDPVGNRVPIEPLPYSAAVMQAEQEQCENRLVHALGIDLHDHRPRERQSRRPAYRDKLRSHSRVGRMQSAVCFAGLRSVALKRWCW
jgi:hypothetical protein